MRHQCTFNFSSSQTMAADVYNIVDASHYPEISIRIPPRTIAGKIDAFNLRPVLLPVSFVVAPDCPQHRRPWLFDHEIATFIWPNCLSITGDDIDVNTWKR